MVNSKGFAVLNSGPNIFNRYVKDAAFCAEDMYLQPAWARTQDFEIMLRRLHMRRRSLQLVPQVAGTPAPECDALTALAAREVLVPASSGKTTRHRLN